MRDTLTVTEAAIAANVSVRTVRRWIANGQVVTRGHGHGRRIVTSSLSKYTATADTTGHQEVSDDRTHTARTDTETANADNRDTNGHEADRLADLVREFTDRLAEQAALIAIWQERARVLSDQLALAAPGTPIAAQPEPETAPTPVEPPMPIWWPLALGVAGVVVVVLLLAWPR